MVEELGPTTDTERQAESSRLSDDQARTSLEFLRAALPDLVSNTHQMSESERGLVEKLSESMVGSQSWRDLAVQTAYLTKRSMDLRAALVVLVELVRHFEGPKALLGLHVSVQDRQIRSLEKELQEVQTLATVRATKAANALHDKPGGSRDKHRRILEAWKSGKYSSRDICAEEEARALGMSFSAARKALRNTPDPA